MSGVRVIALESAPPIELPGGSWSRMLVTGEHVGDAQAALGYSVFKPGSSTATVSHATEEFAYVVSGHGQLQLDNGNTCFEQDDALFIPPNTWHAVVNDSDQDIVMVFGFPCPDYPATERRS